MEDLQQPLAIKEPKRNAIGLFETPLWKPNQFLINEQIPLIPKEDIKSREFVFTEINPEKATFQNDPNSFMEFDSPVNIKKFRYDSNLMKKNGCGIAALYMVLGALNAEKLNEGFKSVGELAIDTLQMHKDDLVINGIKIKRGSPVFNPKSGWYHDALVYEAIKLGVATGERYENVDLFDTAFRLISLQKEGKKALAVSSVKYDSWIFNRNFTYTDSTHLIIINGFKFAEDGLEKIRVTDPFISSGVRFVNKWVSVNKRFSRILNNNVMIFYR